MRLVSEGSLSMRRMVSIVSGPGGGRGGAEEGEAESLESLVSAVDSRPVAVVALEEYSLGSFEACSGLIVTFRAFEDKKPGRISL